jgi:NhaP-type Na+/H+ or K+/H+ antiporter
MRSRNEQDHSVACVGFIGTLTGGVLGTVLGLLYTAYLIRNLDHFDSKEVSTFILFCLLSTPTGGIGGAALGGAAGVGGAFATKFARRALSFFQELSQNQDSEEDRSIEKRVSSATC